MISNLKFTFASYIQILHCFDPGCWWNCITNLQCLLSQSLFLVSLYNIKIEYSVHQNQSSFILRMLLRRVSLCIYLNSYSWITIGAGKTFLFTRSPNGFLPATSNWDATGLPCCLKSQIINYNSPCANADSDPYQTWTPQSLLIFYLGDSCLEIPQRKILLNLSAEHSSTLFLTSFTDHKILAAFLKYFWWFCWYFNLYFL